MAIVTTQCPLFAVHLDDDPEERQKNQFLYAFLSKSGVESILSESNQMGKNDDRKRGVS